MGDIKSQVTIWLLHGKLLLCPSYYLPRDLLQALCIYLKGLCLSFLICKKRIKWGNEMHMKSLLPYYWLTWPSCFISTFMLLPLPLLTLFIYLWLHFAYFSPVVWKELTLLKFLLWLTFIDLDHNFLWPVRFNVNPHPLVRWAIETVYFSCPLYKFIFHYISTI